MTPPPYANSSGKRKPEEPRREEILAAGRKLAAKRMEDVTAAYEALVNTAPDEDSIEVLGRVNDLRRAAQSLEEVEWVAALLADEPFRVSAERTGYTREGARMTTINAMGKLLRDGHTDVVPDSYKNEVTKNLDRSL